MSRIKIHIPQQVADQMRGALLKCGTRECGGILMGEHMGHEEFRVADLTVETESGTVARFMRSVASFLAKLSVFFERTEHRYQQFNYLGEWHSHPLFPLQPSQDDFHTTRDIVDDPDVGATFVVLILVKLNGNHLESRVWSLLPGAQFSEGDVVYKGTAHE